MRNAIPKVWISLLISVLASCIPSGKHAPNAPFAAIRIEPGRVPVDMQHKVCVFTLRIFSGNGNEIYTRGYLPLVGIIDTLYFDSLETKNPLREMLRFNQEGDSSVFHLRAGEFFPASGYVSYKALLPGDSLLVALRTHRILPTDDFREITARKANTANVPLAPDKDTGFINCVKRIGFTPEQQVYPGLYKQVIEEGRGLPVTFGEEVLVEWQGSFVDGKVFDTNRESGGFEYVVGTPDQLLPGLQLGVGTMKKGERALFLLHPSLGFGVRGSANGLVPPNKSLIFELFLQKQKP